MKGYVKFAVSEDVKNKMVAYLDKAQIFILDYDPIDFSKQVEKKTFFLKRKYSTTVVLSLEELGEILPVGVWCSGYKLFWNRDTDDVERFGHCLDLTIRAKGVEKILSLYDNNINIMLDDQLASVYNTFKD